MYIFKCHSNYKDTIKNIKIQIYLSKSGTCCDFGEEASGYIKIPDNTMNEIIDLYTNKFITIKTLTENYNYGRDKITNELKNNSIEVSNGIYFSEKNINIIIDLYVDEKYSLQQIINKLGLKDRRVISKILKNNNIKINPCGGKNRDIKFDT